MKKICNFLILLLILPSLLAADDLDIFGGGGSEEKGVNVEGSVISRFNIDLSKDSYYEFTKESRNKFYFSLSGDIKTDLSFKVSLLDKYYIFYSDYEETYSNKLNVWDAVVNYSSDKYELHLGKQTVTWGVSDVSPIDVVNPAEMEEFVFSEESFIKIPVLMGVIDYYLDDYNTIEGVFVPFYVPSDFSMLDSDWSLMPRTMYYAQIKRYEYDFNRDLSSQNMAPYYMKYPKDSPFNGEIGGVLKHYGEGIDYQIAAYSGWDKMPLPEFNPQLLDYLKNSKHPMDDLNNLSLPETIDFSPLMKFEPRRFFLVGGGVSTSLGGVGIRSEMAYKYKSAVYSEHLQMLRVPSFTVNFGADYNFPYDLYGNLIFTVSHFFTDKDTYLYKRTNYLLVLLLRGSYMHDSLLPQLKVMYDFGQFEYFVSFDLGYDYTDNITVNTGINVLDGEKNTVIYQFRNNDFGYLSVKYSF